MSASRSDEASHAVVIGDDTKMEAKGTVASATSAAAAASANTTAPTTGQETKRKGVTTTLAIVGSAGRRDDAAKMTLALFDAMTRRVQKTITDDLALTPAQVVLTSGGAAWADHIAVKLYLRGGYAGLRLYLPGKWQSSAKEFVGTKDAAIANRYHQAFSAKCGFSSLAELDVAFKRGASATCRKDFKTRNLDVAKSQHLIALTWATGPEPPLEGSGTRHTWDAWHGYHFSPMRVAIRMSCERRRNADNDQAEQASAPPMMRLHIPLITVSS